MKLKIFLIISTFFMIAKTWADGDIDQQNIGSENIKEPAKSTKQSPFSFSSHIDVIGSSKITNKGFYKGDKVNYAEAKVELGAIVYYEPVYTEGLNVALGFEPTYLRREKNPWSEQNHFNLLSLSFTGFSKRLSGWFWRTQFTINTDVEEWSGQYTSYDILLWGRYSYRENIGIHFGFWAETGLHMDRVYPVLGFDWIISKDWTLNLVYPMNIALNYSVTPHWILSLAARNFDSRFRIHPDEACPRSLVRYTNVGAEFAIKYITTEINANIHVGTTLAGKYRVATQKNHHAHTYNLDSSLYAGGEIEVRF